MYPSEWFPASEIILNSSHERTILNICYNIDWSVNVKQNIVQVSKCGIKKKKYRNKSWDFAIGNKLRAINCFKQC